METIEVKVGQVWADADKRSAGRHVRVIALLPAVPAKDGHSRALPARAEVALCTANDRIIQTLAGKETRTKIRLDRFKPTANGYRLIQDAPEEN